MTRWRSGDTGERPLTVLLSLAPAYAHGLGGALEREGLDVVTVTAAEDVAPLTDGRVAAVVVSAERQGLLTADCAGKVAVVVLAGERSPSAYADALRQGAAGVIDTAASVEEIVEVVSAALRGWTLVPATIVAGLVTRMPARATPPLSGREVEWLRSLADSTTVSRLARVSGYSEREMYRLLGNVYSRLGATSRTEALLTAQRYGLLELPDRDRATQPGDDPGHTRDRSL